MFSFLFWKIALLVSHGALPVFPYKTAYKEWDISIVVRSAVILTPIAVQLSAPTSQVCGDL